MKPWTSGNVFVRCFCSGCEESGMFPCGKEQKKKKHIPPVSLHNGGKNIFPNRNTKRMTGTCYHTDTFVPPKEKPTPFGISSYLMPCLLMLFFFASTSNHAHRKNYGRRYPPNVRSERDDRTNESTAEKASFGLVPFGIERVAVAKTKLV